MFVDSVIEYVNATDDDRNQILSLIEAAEDYLTNAGIAVNENNPLYALAVKILVSHWYDNKQPIGTATKLAFGLADIISQLQNCG